MHYINKAIYMLSIICLIYLQSAKCDFNRFQEELLIRPLPSGHIYSHFEFSTHWHNEDIEKSIVDYKNFEFFHYDYFPRALGEIIEKYHVRELHLSLTQGLWRYQKWGYPVSDAPPGAQLYAWFKPDTMNIDQNWKDLVNALSGLFCASLNFIDQTNTVSPELSFRPEGLADKWYSGNSTYMRYAALPRENVCTENLTPWKKLLPCDTKSGLTTLLRPSPMYSAHYHSLAVHFRPVCKDKECISAQLELVQSLSVVQTLLPEMHGKQDWSLRSLYSIALLSVCPLTDSSKIYVDITGSENLQKFTLNPVPSYVQQRGDGISKRSYAVYDLYEFVTGNSFNLAAKYSKKHIFGIIPPTSLEIVRFITGHGQEGGSITVKLHNHEETPLNVVYMEVLPWYLRLFFHSSHTEQIKNSIHVSKLVTARDRERGWLYEVVLQLPPRSSIELNLEFSRALLKWLEYPPDANHGFYIPAAIASTIIPTSKNVTTGGLNTGSLFDKLDVKDGPAFVRMPTETLLVSLPTPDFSMPYNVICLACTVVALAFGPIHNMTTKKLTIKKLESKGIFQKLIDKVKVFFKKDSAKSNIAGKIDDVKSYDECIQNITN